MIDPIAFKLGPFSIHWYALCIVSGLVLAVYLAMREAPRKKMNPDDVLDFILYAFPISIIGARIYYVTFEWDYYSVHPSEIIAIWNGGIAIYGGLITGAICMAIFCYRHFINVFDFLDIAAPGVLIAQSIGRWGNFINQEAYGQAVDNLNWLPSFIRNQMYIDNAYRQPTFLYESLWTCLGFIILMTIRHRSQLLRRSDPTAFYLIWYGLGRFVIEGMRTDSLYLAGLRVSQWLSVILVILGIVLVIRSRRQDDPTYY